MGNRTLRIGVRVVFALSLLMNAIVLGLVWRLADFRDEFGLRGTQIPREVRAEFRARIDGNDALTAALANLGTARRAMIAAADERPFDPVAVEAAMANVRTATSGLQDEAQRVLLDSFAAVAEE